jgi:plastocyanin
MRFTSLVAFLLVGLAACGGSDGGGTTTPVRVVSRVTVTAPTTTINPGETVQLSAAAFDNAGAQISNPGNFVWSTSSTTVASVDQTGKVAGIAAGTAIVTADLSGVRGTLSVKVNLSATTVKDTIFTLPAQWVPAFLTINVGESVVFTFGGGIQHNAIFSKFNVAGSPPDIGNFTNQSFTRTFNTRGKFPFECTLHNGMVGEITVQ